MTTFEQKTWEREFWQASACAAFTVPEIDTVEEAAIVADLMLIEWRKRFTEDY